MICTVMKVRSMYVKFVFAWYDFWVGVFYDRTKRRGQPEKHYHPYYLWEHLFVKHSLNIANMLVRMAARRTVILNRGGDWAEVTTEDAILFLHDELNGVTR